MDTLPATTDMSDIVRLLSPQEEAFVLAYIEHGGNSAAAYKASFGEDAEYATAQASILLRRPEVSSRIRELNDTIAEAACLSLAAHMQQLAEIRDVAKAQGSLKVSLAAEVKRGEVAGLYVGKTGAAVVVNNNSTPQPDRLTRLASRLTNLNSKSSDAVDVQARVIGEDE